MKLLLIDNYDSFTYNLLHQLQKAGAECRLVRNDQARSCWYESAWDAAVISPGPATPSEAGWLMDFIATFADHKPILGVCLGHQALGIHFGAKLIRAPKPLHGKSEHIHLLAHAFFGDLPATIQVMRYHSLVLSNLPDVLEVLAKSDDACLMAFKHRELPLIGLQFHPESILSPFGDKLIQQFLQLVKKEALPDISLS